MGQRVSGEFAIYNDALWTASLCGPEILSPLRYVCSAAHGRFMSIYGWLGIWKKQMLNTAVMHLKASLTTNSFVL